MEKSSYRPEIDGLRALAVIAVVLFHAGLGFPGGYVGVDVFFVISGFLITGIIRRELERSTFSLANFWERRIRRIFPPLFVMVAVVLGLGYWRLLPHELEELGKSSIAQAFLLANVYFWRDTGYFAGPAELKPLLHTWSLAVEEQFYLFFPLLLVALRSQSRTRLFGWLACMAIVSLGGSVYGTMYHAGAAFFLLPSRAWELLVGCMLAVLPWKLESRSRRDGAIAITGLFAILIPVFCYDSETPFPGLAAIPPVIGTAAVIFSTATSHRTLVGRFLSTRPLVFVGLISYSLYLWHWPVIVFVRMHFGQLGWPQITLALACSFALSILSWKFIETPCRRSTFLRKRRSLFATALSLSGVTVAASMLLIGTGGFPSRFSRYALELLDDVTWTEADREIPLGEALTFETLPRLGMQLDDNQDVRRPDFMLWGDSHGLVLCPMLSDVAAECELSGVSVLTSGQVPLLGVQATTGGTYAQTQIRFRENVRELIKTTRPRNLILVSRWSWYTDGYTDIELKANPSLTTTEHLLTHAHAPTTSAGNCTAALVAGLQELVSLCDENDTMLWIVKQVPEVGGTSPAYDLFLRSIGRRETMPDDRTSIEQHRQRQRMSEKVFDTITADGVRFLDPAPFLFSEDEMTIVVQDGRSLYRDDDHLTRHGADRLRDLFHDAMIEMKRNKPIDERCE